ncbi:hypothetical protein EV182_007342 [Spiromyces aspiralis]|uniref:Uncharacterized protein n=1 Tax=Spiromyces aspiralis TaxID=68401 RepID=A0ACC1HNN0_9FUNG|nr:hypothetical protein EV182_007342 [Spiromyces aspiralis]
MVHVIAQPDFRDMTCMSGEFRAFIGDLIKKRTWIGASLSCPEKKSPLRGVTVGIPIEYWVDELADRVRDAWREAAVRLASLGADIVQVSLPSTRHALPAYYIIAPAEASTNLARYDGIRYGHRTEPEHQGESVGEEFMTTRKEGFGEEVQRRILLGTHSLTTG